MHLHVVKAQVFRSQTAPQACVSFRLPVIVSVWALVFKTNCQEHIHQAWPSVGGRLLQLSRGQVSAGYRRIFSMAQGGDITERSFPDFWVFSFSFFWGGGLFFLPFFPFIAVPQKCVPPLKTLVHERLPSEEAQPREDLILTLTKFYRNCSKGLRASGSSIDKQFVSASNSLLFSAAWIYAQCPPPFSTPSPCTSHCLKLHYSLSTPDQQNQNPICFKLENFQTSAWHPGGRIPYHEAAYSLN